MKLLRIRIGEHQSKSRTMVRRPHGTGQKGNARVKGLWANLAFALPACMYYPHCCYGNYGKLEHSDNPCATHGGFPTGSGNFGSRRWYFRACGTGSLAETAKGLNSSPLPPMAVCPGFCKLEGVACSLLTWEQFLLDVVSLAAMT